MSTVDLGGALWRKSRRSSDAGQDNCVEVAFVGGVTAVRDSKNPSGPVIMVPAAPWRAFVAGRLPRDEQIAEKPAW
jgi:hypothetical protein